MSNDWSGSLKDGPMSLRSLVVIALLLAALFGALFGAVTMAFLSCGSEDAASNNVTCAPPTEQPLPVVAIYRRLGTTPATVIGFAPPSPGDTLVWPGGSGVVMSTSRPSRLEFAGRVYTNATLAYLDR